MMKEPTMLAPSAMSCQVVAPIWYGLEDPYRLPSADSRCFVLFLRDKTVLLCCCVIVSIIKISKNGNSRRRECSAAMERPCETQECLSS